MSHLRVIDGSIAKRKRKAAVPGDPICPNCDGREYVAAKIGKTATKLCVACMLRGRRVVMQIPLSGS